MAELPSLQLWETSLLAASMACFSIVTVTGSLLIILSTVTSMMTSGNKMKSRNNAFIINLMVADLLVGISTMPITTVSVVNNGWVFGKFLCDASGFLDNAALVSSLWTLAMSSVDRYYFVTHPFTYFRVMTHRRILYMVFFTWTHSCMLAACPLLGWDSYKYSQHSYNCGFEASTEGFHKYYFLVFFLLSMPIPVFLCSYYYLKLLFITRKRLQVQMAMARYTSSGPSRTVTAIKSGMFPSPNPSAPQSKSQNKLYMVKYSKHGGHETAVTLATTAMTASVPPPATDISLTTEVQETTEQAHSTVLFRESLTCAVPTVKRVSENPSVDVESSITNKDTDFSNGNPSLRKHNSARRNRNAAIHRKVTVSVFVIVGCYILFTVPLFCTGLIYWATGINPKTPYRVSVMAHWLFVGKSACNPILFASLNPQIQNGFKKIVTWVLGKVS